MNQCYLGQKVRFNELLKGERVDFHAYPEDSDGMFCIFVPVDTEEVYTIIEAVDLIDSYSELPVLGTDSGIKLHRQSHSIFVRLGGMVLVESTDTPVFEWVNICWLEPVQNEQTNSLLEAPNLE